MKPKFLLLQKAGAVEDEDGALTPAGMAVAQRYARRWVADGVRDLEAERQYPTLVGLFYDIRSDVDLAREHASEEKPVRKSLDEQIVMVRPEVATLTVSKLLSKAGGPYIGERGGKWADPQHTIHWEEGGGKPAGKGAEAGGEKKPAAPAAPVQVVHKHVPLHKKEDFAGKRNWTPHFEGLPQETKSAYTTPDGQYIPERARMHEEMIADAFRGKHAVPPGQKPVAIMMMGGGASGKSTLVRKQFEEKGLLQNYVTINSDDVKEQLPEYEMATKDPQNTAKDAAAMVHEESSDVAGEMLNRATKPGQQFNFVFDGTGANARKYGAIIDKLKSQGYHVHLMYADVENPDDAWARSSSRADKTGRWVPEKMLRHAHGSIPQNFEGLAGKVDSYAMYQLPREGGHKEVMTGQGGRHEVHDPSYLGAFRDRANKLKTAEEQAKAQAGAPAAPSAAPAAPPAPAQTPPAPAPAHAAAPAAPAAPAAASAAPPPPPAPGGNMPSKPVAKSMTAAYNQGEMKKAFPPQQQKPPQQERFVMTRPGGQPPAAPPPGGTPPAGVPPAPQAAAPKPPAPKPPMPPGQPGAAPGQPQAATPTPPPGNTPPAATAPASGAPGAQAGGKSMPVSPDFNFDDFHQAVLSAKPEKAPAPVAPSKKAAGEPEEEDNTPFPEDDFSWALAALERHDKEAGQSGQPAAKPAPQQGQPLPTPSAPPGAPKPPLSNAAPGQAVQTPQKPLT